jgi:hypothetical protein
MLKIENLSKSKSGWLVGRVGRVGRGARVNVYFFFVDSTLARLDWLDFDSAVHFCFVGSALARLDWLTLAHAQNRNE